jgi:hypothetical protein
MLGFTFLLSGHPSFAFAGSHLQAGEPQGYGFMNLYPVRLLRRSLCPSFLFPFYGGGFGSGKSCIFLVFLNDTHTHTHTHTHTIDTFTIDTHVYIYCFAFGVTYLVVNEETLKVSPSSGRCLFSTTFTWISLHFD